MVQDAQRRYARPVPCARAMPTAWQLAGTAIGFREVEVLGRDACAEVLPAEACIAGYPELAGQVANAAARRPTVPGLPEGRPAVMGVLNVTPDSFSDGGLHASTEAAIAHGLRLAEAGADILDVGGESTRPGAEPVAPEAEAARVVPVIEGLRAAGCRLPVSIDTRNAATARAARAAGADILNDVSAMGHDTAMPGAASAFDALCLMHARGNPQTMQRDPRYGDVLLDVFDYLEARLAAASTLGFARERVLVDPGIGFGKTAAHNLTLLRGLSLFHALGAPLMVGVSRKRFIGTIGGAAEPHHRMPGSLAVGLYALGQGVHVLRVHDVAETAQALKLWHALEAGWSPAPREASEEKR